MTTEEKPDNRCAVDIRIFFLAIITSMTCAFLAGIWYVPPQALAASLHLYFTKSHRQLTKPRSLELSKADLYKSSKYSPSGQHILVDIEGVDSDFLDSEERLSNAMVQTVQQAGLTMLSYHCHKLSPAGISCVGVLLESHISFHTWPEEGVITLDLFTCGAKPLLPVVPVMEDLFGIGENAKAKWSHELRGFRSMEEKRANYLDNLSDLSMWVLSPVEIHTKKMIYSNLTKYQRVDIWDLTEPENAPTYWDGLKHGFEDGDPRFLDSDYYTPDRILFLDGTIQSLYSADATYHEALVHPVMFVHPSPARVAIIGGGEGATLREVLKHNTLKHVTMIEIDEELIEIVREYLPQMSDCSDLVGRADNCFDDELVDVVVENGAKWFIDRYGSSPPVESAPADPFDVLIVDALDPEDTSTFWKDLYGDSIFVSSLMKSLSEEGVLMIRIGQTPDLSDPRPDLGPYKVREKLLQMFEEHPDVAAMHVYEEMRSGFLDPHSFLVVCRNVSCRSRWYAKSDVIDYNIYDRIVKTKSGREALKFFDGTTQYSYQVPPMHWEAVYCRREPTPFECAYRSLDFSKPIHEFYLDNDERSSFRIEMKSNDEGKLIGSSVFAKVHIPKGSFIMPDHLARSVVLSEESIESIQSNVNMGAPVYQALTNFIEWNAHKTHIEGTEVRHLEVGATILIREVASEEEANVGRWVPPHPTGKCPPFSPVYDRHRFSFNTFMVATRDIPAGDELTRFEKMWQ